MTSLYVNKLVMRLFYDKKGRQLMEIIKMADIPNFDTDPPRLRPGSAIRLGDLAFVELPAISSVRVGTIANTPDSDTVHHFEDYINIPKDDFIRYALHLMAEDAKKSLIGDILALSADGKLSDITKVEQESRLTSVLSDIYHIQSIYSSII